MKNFFLKTVKLFPKIAVCAAAAVLLILYPQEAADGIRSGLSLLASDVIPALFPFIVISSYTVISGAAENLCRIFAPFTSFFFKTGPNALLPLIMGLTGGYPVGAKAVADQYERGKITPNEAERLMFYCINSSPAFTISAVGVMCLGSIKSGLILYFSCVLSSLTIGFCCRFLDNGERIPSIEAQKKPLPHPFTLSVSSATEAMLGIAGWILVFSVLARFADLAKFDENTLLFIKSVCEVTTGCKAAAGSVPLQFISAILGFGGFAVICQITVYTEKCKVELKRVLSSRFINASLCAFYTTLLLKIFPVTIETAAEINIGKTSFAVAQTAPAAAFLMLMCAAFILEVDNRRKVC